MFICVSKCKVSLSLRMEKGNKNVIAYRGGSEIAPYSLQTLRTPEASP